MGRGERKNRSPINGDIGQIDAGMDVVREFRETNHASPADVLLAESKPVVREDSKPVFPKPRYSPA